MINKIRLKDFQGHKDSTLNLGKGINVICGSSGTGKSSIIRALNYLFTNKKSPNVKYERRPDAKGFEIEVEIDGHTIKRVKGTRANEYHIDDQVYKDIGVNVPDKVFEVSNIKPIKVGTEEFNVQLAKQFDPHFLMFLPDSSKVKFLNRLSGAYIVDIALKETNKELLQVEKEKLTCENNITELTTQINNCLDILTPLTNVLEKVKIEYERLNEAVNRLQALKSLKSKYDLFKQQKDKYEQMSAVLAKVNIEGFDFKIERLKKLIELRDKYETCVDGITHYTTYETTVSKIDMDKLEQQVNRLGIIKQLKEDYNSLSKRIETIDKEQKDIEVGISNKVKDVAEFFKNNPKCPTCNATITKAKITKILKELE